MTFLKALANALAGSTDAAARPFFESTAWEGANPPLGSLPPRFSREELMINFQLPDDVAIRAAQASAAHALALAAARDPRPVTDRLAEAMIVMAENGQTVTADELRLRGFTAAEIEEHGSEAADLAVSLQRAA